jgi:hypothetical protein
MKKDNRFIHKGLTISKLNPKKNPERLIRWLAAPRIPILVSEEPLVTMCIQAMLKGEQIDLIYVGGSTPGASREINVSLVFQHMTDGGIYVAGYYHSRKANRIFRIDLAMVIHARN